MSVTQDSFSGRDEELRELLDVVDKRVASVIWLTGESGVGKTFLANRLLRRTIDSIQRFAEQRSGTFSGYAPEEKRTGEPFDWFAANLASKVLKNRNPKVSQKELVAEIIKVVDKEQWVVLLDNAETVNQASLTSFVNQWSQSCQDSVLIITSTEEMEPARESRFRTHHLQGLKKKDAILKLLDDLRQRILAENLDISDDYLVTLVNEKLQGFPRLVNALNHYGHGLRALNEGSLNKLTAKLADDPGAVLSRKFDSESEDPIVHVLALGQVQSLEIEERLLFWLWDKLTGAGLEGYARVRDRLIERDFFEQQILDESVHLRIHPRDHMLLFRSLRDRIGEALISNVEYYLSEYYREEYHRHIMANVRDNDSSITQDPKLNDFLRLYVHHAIQGRNVAGVFEYLFQPAALRLIHHSGYAFLLKPVLMQLEKHLKKRCAEVDESLQKLGQHKPSNDETDSAQSLGEQQQSEQAALESERAVLHRQLAEAKIEVAHCLNDLSEHPLCLKYLDDAKELLKELVDPILARSLEQRIYYLSGISNSDLGRPGNCVRAYAECVRKSGPEEMQPLQLNERAILALGYLALELRFEDQEQSLALGRQSLHFAEQHKNDSLIAKACCNLAQIKFFAGRVDESDELFGRAEHLCQQRRGASDIRELGRVCTYRSMVYINQGDLKRADELIKQGAEINQKSGDRRRQFSAKALCGLVEWHRDNHDSAVTLMEEAITHHHELEDWRNASVESLSYAYMLNHRTLPDILKAAESEGDAKWALVILTAPAEARNTFHKFWANCYRQRLLELI